MSDEDKVGLDVSEHQNLATSLVSVHDSQVAAAKAMTWRPSGGAGPRHLLRDPRCGRRDVDDLRHGPDAVGQDPSLSVRDFVCRTSTGSRPTSASGSTSSTERRRLYRRPIFTRLFAAGGLRPVFGR